MAVGDITYSNVGGETTAKAFASGTVVADADTAINVIVGFVPSRIVLYYKDAGAVTDDVKIEWFKGMTAANYIKSIAAGGWTLETSGGPVVYGDTSDDTWPTGDAPTYEETSGTGFTIPAGLQATDSDTIYWMAFR